MVERKEFRAVLSGRAKKEEVLKHGRFLVVVGQVEMCWNRLCAYSGRLRLDFESFGSAVR